jgi:hypothetical protein
MDIVSDLTVVVGLDAKTHSQWQVSLPTIAQHRSELLKAAWFVFYDSSKLSPSVIRETARRYDIDNLVCQPWPWKGVGTFASQRAKMLAGFVHATVNVQTDWWLKIDTDVVAVPCEDWIQQAWFENSPVLIASPWGYTKCKGDARNAQEWCDALEDFGDSCFPGTSRLNLHACIRGDKKIVRKRFWSPVSCYSTEFTTSCSQFCELVCGSGQLPVPSQDTVHWYVAERCGLTYKTVRMQHHGWQFCSSTRKLHESAEHILSKVTTNG